MLLMSILQFQLTIENGQIEILIMIWKIVSQRRNECKGSA